MGRQATIGLLAHVDAGKTTLAEALLHRTGAIRVAGRVDHGDAHLDFDPIERERGITVFSKQAHVSHDGWDLTLLDAPGHVDFGAEAERTMFVLDMAVLVVGANDGVQGHTRTLWRLLQRYDVPVVMFVNKTDLANAGPRALMEQLTDRLGATFADVARLQDEATLEQVAMADEEALDEYLESGKLGIDTLRRLVGHRAVVPCVFGSALREQGVDELLDVLTTFLPRRVWPEAFGALAYKVTHGVHGERITWLKVTGGTLRAKMLVEGTTARGDTWEDKIDQVRIYQGDRFEVTDQVSAGGVCAVTGLSQAHPTDGMGCQASVGKPSLAPVMEFQVMPVGCDAHAVYQALLELSDEDPLLDASWHAGVGEVCVRLMGKMQQEVVQRLLLERYGLGVEFGPGSVLYAETIAEPAYGIGHFEPLRHYAEVHLRLEPAERGMGVVACSECSEDELARNWQRLILGHVLERTHRGVLTGAALTDVRIVLVAGRAHAKHTQGGDFRQATYRAIRQGLMGARNVLLEPWYHFVLEVPTNRVGRALSDLQRMEARFETPAVVGETATVEGSAPVSTMRGYALDVSSYTAGQGRLFVEPQGMEPCHDAQDVIANADYDPVADLEHTPDSVFCSHGAGYNVSWEEVFAKAHVACD